MRRNIYSKFSIFDNEHDIIRNEIAKGLKGEISFSDIFPFCIIAGVITELEKKYNKTDLDIELVNRAIGRKDINALKGYIENNPDIIEKNKVALLKAIALQNIDIVKILLDAGANISIFSNLPFKFACMIGEMEIINTLIKYGIEVSNINDNILIYAINGNNFNLFEFLLEKGAKVNENDSFALAFATQKGSIEFAKYLLEHGADPNCFDGEPLMSAIFNIRKDLAKLLLDAGAKIEENDRAAFKILKENLCFWYPCVEIMEMLIDQFTKEEKSILLRKIIHLMRYPVENEEALNKVLYILTKEGIKLNQESIQYLKAIKNSYYPKIAKTLFKNIKLR